MRGSSDRCLALAETCHISSLLKRIAELRRRKDILAENLETTPHERRLADAKCSIQKKQKQLDKLPLFAFSKRREVKQEIDALAFMTKKLDQEARDERADIEREAAIKIDVLRKEHAPLLAELLSCIEKGTTIYFGSEARSDKRTMWRVGSIDGSTLLLVADSTSTVMRPYHSKPVEQVTWNKSTLRAWLNTTFVDGTFTKQEQALIARQRKSSSDDLVFIPSAKEWDALDSAIRSGSKGYHKDISMLPLHVPEHVA